MRSRFAWLLVTLRRYPEEFCREVLDLVAACRPVAQVAADLAISDETICAWRNRS